MKNKRQMGQVCGIAILLAVSIGMQAGAGQKDSLGAAKWINDATKATLPKSPVTGKLNGTPFTVKTVTLSKTTALGFSDNPVDVFALEFAGESRTAPKGKWVITLVKQRNAKWETQRFVRRMNDSLVAPESATPAKPLIMEIGTIWRGEPGLGSGPATAQIQFGKPQGKILSGSLYVCLEDGKQSVLAGTFKAAVK